MQDYSEYPPVKYFTRVLKTCPKSAYLYVQIWKNKGKYDTLIVQKKDVRKEHLISPTMFRNLLAPLMLLNLLNFRESEDKIQIDFMGAHLND